MAYDQPTVSLWAVFIFLRLSPTMLLQKKIVSVTEHKKYLQNQPGRSGTEPPFVCHWVGITQRKVTWESENWEQCYKSCFFSLLFYWSENSTQCNKPEMSSVKDIVPQTLKWNQGTKQPQQTQFSTEKTDSLLCWPEDRQAAWQGYRDYELEIKAVITSSSDFFFFKCRIILLCPAAIFKQNMGWLLVTGSVTCKTCRESFHNKWP